MGYGPPTGIALVITDALKLPGLPVNPLVTADAVLTVTVAVPDGTMPDPAFRLPCRVIGDCPKTMDCEAVRPLNVGVAFTTCNVKVCVASGVTPLVALIVMV